MKTLAALALALITIAAPAMAQTAPFTGKWTGTLTREGVANPGHGELNLTQKGKVLTGTAGPDSQRQSPIEKGVVTGTKATFEVAQGSGVMKFSLSLVKGHLTGDVVMTNNGQSQSAKIDMTKAAPAVKK